MKSFIFTIKKSTVRRYGGMNETAEIYRVKNNSPFYVGTASWCTASYKGKESEILSAIKKELTRKEQIYFLSDDRKEFYSHNRKEIPDTG